MNCAWCGGECKIIHYKTERDAGHKVPWSGWRALWFNAEADVDFCSPLCSLSWVDAHSQRAAIR